MAQTATVTNVDALKTKVKALTDWKHLKNGTWGFVLYEVESGKRLLSHNREKTLLPASTLKTFTSGAALGILGENFRFETKLEYSGKLSESGILEGDLYIRGGGDPTLGSSRFPWGTDADYILEEWEAAIRKAGIKEITGRVIGDAGIFEDALIPVNWVWNDIGNYYGAGACGLTFHENLYYLYFEPSATVGATAALLRTEPEIPGIEFINEMKTGKRGSGDQGYVFGGPYSYLRYLRGTIPQGKSEFSIKGSIPDPALYAAQTLTSFLREKGIAVANEANTVRMITVEGDTIARKGTLIDTHRSPKLKEIVYWLNKKSLNLYAEHLLKMCGWKRYKDGSTAAGARAIEAYWSAKGISVSGLHQNDGSGLSRYNGITVDQLTLALRSATKESWFESFFESLPIAGLSSDPGTLRRMCKDSKAANNLRAKSGYISRVRGYTGYVNTQSGKQLCFAMVANNYTSSNRVMRDKFEELMVALGDLE